MKLQRDWFFVGLALATLLAWRFPGPGAAGGWLHPEWVTKFGVALIFFLHGAALSFAALKAGTLRWPLHLLVQASTFLVFPLLGLGLIAALDGRVPRELGLGLFFLCALPSTVSSSVALTATAGGNVAGALFNATLSSVLGIFVTPLWVALVLKTGGEAQPLGPVVADLFAWLLLPLALGQLSRPLLANWVRRHAATVSRLDRATILLLVYTSFCDSFAQGIWSRHGWATLAIVVGVCGGLFAIVMTLVAWLSRRMGLARGERIAAMFCGSKKTLAAGVPMARLIFGAHPAIGVILLPIMIYHPLQLVICGVLAQRWARQQEETHGHPGGTR